MTKPASHTDATKNPDDLIKDSAIELDETSLDAVAGGVSANKAKTANKNFEAFDGYIRG